jgi:hypothetical protein
MSRDGFGVTEENEIGNRTRDLFGDQKSHDIRGNRTRDLFGDQKSHDIRGESNQWPKNFAQKSSADASKKMTHKNQLLTKPHWIPFEKVSVSISLTQTSLFHKSGGNRSSSRHRAGCHRYLQELLWTSANLSDRRTASRKQLTSAASCMLF